MKILFFAFIFQIAAYSCTKPVAVNPTVSIIGVWEPTYQIQNLNADGTWSEWITINTLIALPTYEFTEKGRFLLNGKIDESCCMPGSLFKLNGNTISFQYEKAPDCSTIKCANTNEKTIFSMDENYLVLIESSGRVKNKYRKAK